MFLYPVRLIALHHLEVSSAFKYLFQSLVSFYYSFLETSIESEDDKGQAAVQLSQEEEVQRVEPSRYDVDAVEAIAMLQPGGENQNVNPLEALLGAGLPPLLDIPPDADDEAMVELAIALSLQDHELGGDLPQGQQALHNLQVGCLFTRNFVSFSCVAFVVHL